MIEQDLIRVRKQIILCQETLHWPYPIGIEIVNKRHVENQLNNDGHVLGRFTPEEIEYCQTTPNYDRYAGHVAGKQAVRNILGQNTPWQDIAIGHQPSGEPTIHLKNQALAFAKSKNIDNIPISISHDEGRAVGFAMGVNSSAPMVSLGTDISSVGRVARLYQEQGERFLRKIYTKQEAHEATGNTTVFATKWAVKEAVAKVLKTGFWRKGVAWTDISVHIACNGLLSIDLGGAALKQARAMGIENWDIHIIGTQEVQIAFVVGS